MYKKNLLLFLLLSSMYCVTSQSSSLPKIYVEGFVDCVDTDHGPVKFNCLKQWIDSSPKSGFFQERCTLMNMSLQGRDVKVINVERGCFMSGLRTGKMVMPRPDSKSLDVADLSEAEIAELPIRVLIDKASDDLRKDNKYMRDDGIFCAMVRMVVDQHRDRLGF